jgi:hypothetical protein
MTPASDPEWPSRREKRRTGSEEVTLGDAYLLLKDKRHEVNAADLPLSPGPDDGSCRRKGGVMQSQSAPLAFRRWATCSETAKNAGDGLSLSRGSRMRGRRVFFLALGAMDRLRHRPWRPTSREVGASHAFKKSSAIWLVAWGLGLHLRMQRTDR